METASGFIVINEADFDPSKHQLWNSEVTTATPEPSSAEPNAHKPHDLMTLTEPRDHDNAHGIAITPPPPPRKCDSRRFQALSRRFGGEKALPLGELASGARLRGQGR